MVVYDAEMDGSDLLIVGAGPAGLATAIAAHKAGLDYAVLEKGALVESIYRFPRQMTFFTTPDLLEIGGLPFVTPYEKPTQGEALRYYRRVADTYDLRLELGRAVTGLVREGDLFRLEVEAPRGAEVRRSRHVVLATGYYDHPNRLGVPGEDLPHVSHYWTEAHAYYRRRVVVVGGKNSAAIAALELHRAGAHVTLVHRRARLADGIKYWIKPDIENRIKEGAIAARMETTLVRIEPERVLVRGPEGDASLSADAVFLLTGYYPDASLLRQAGVDVDAETLKPALDLETLETNVPGLFVAGAVASGRETSRIFIENGRFHGEAIVAAIQARGLVGSR
ncbi:MAG TPA: YpdA family putative bacillithiol disulfide reductase [Vicinamibacteria bacterium]|nr:YpdA family putative bacillithiol disulfide reductase [Vicinamibacteria bacterium]